MEKIVSASVVEAYDSDGNFMGWQAQYRLHTGRISTGPVWLSRYDAQRDCDCVEEAWA